MIQFLQGLLIILHILVADFCTEIDLSHSHLNGLPDHLLVHSRTAVKHKRDIGKLPDLLKDIQVNIRLPMVISMGISNSDGKGIRLTEKQKGFHHSRIRYIFVLLDNPILKSLKLTDFCLNRKSEAPRDLDHLPGHSRILLCLKLRSVNHYAGKSQANRLHTNGEVRSMIQVNRHRNIYLLRAPAGDIREKIIAGESSGGDIVCQYHRASHLLSRLAAGPDDVVISTLGIDRRNSIAPGSRPFQFL